MRKLKIKIFDLVAKSPTNTLWARIMHANMASIMPQVIATWCEQEGHQVSLICYTGNEDLARELQDKTDLVFITSFTQAAQQAYSLSNWFQSTGTVTALGGPHARCYPQDASKYFDYVLGFTDQETIKSVLDECISHRPIGKRLTAKKQPVDLPGVKQRWKFIEPILKKAPALKMTNMIGSLGCPYTCNFCIDSVVPYQAINYETIIEDLEFLLTKFKRPWVGWHDPNFGVRFNDFVKLIEEKIPPKSFNFVAESSLSLLSEEHLETFKNIGMVGILPGIESWYEMGNKSKALNVSGIDKVNQVSDHVNMILKYIPYIQTNFVFGLDCDEGSEPFELTKTFIDKSPGAFPGYSLLTAFGQAAPLNLEFQSENRVLGFPFHFLNNHLAMNVKPKHYSWVEFYDHLIDVTKYSFSRKAIRRRFMATNNKTSKWMNFMRAISSEGYGRIRFFKKVRSLLDKDIKFRDYFEQETDVIPDFYTNIIKKDLGFMWEWLPKDSIYHDQNAYLKEHQQETNPQVELTAKAS